MLGFMGRIGDLGYSSMYRTGRVLKNLVGEGAGEVYWVL